MDDSSNVQVERGGPENFGRPSDGAVATVVVASVDPSILPLYDRLTTLRAHAVAIEREIRTISLQLGLPLDSDKQRWHCLRCNHDWLGAAITPRYCPRCHSSAWTTPPSRPDHRAPTDDINPRWYRAKGTRRSRRRGRPRKGESAFAPETTTIATEPLPGPSQLPPLHLPSLKATALIPSAMAIPPLPPPSAPLVSAPQSLRPLADRLRRLAEEPPQPEHLANMDSFTFGVPNPDDEVVPAQLIEELPIESPPEVHNVSLDPLNDSTIPPPSTSLDAGVEQRPPDLGADSSYPARDDHAERLDDRDESSLRDAPAD